MKSKAKILCCAIALGIITSHAQLAVTVSPPKVIGQKTIVQLAIKNNFKESVKSARAICFLLDKQGKMVGQSAKWVIGQNKVSLEPSATNAFNFVITSGQSFIATNLTAKVSFSRIVFSDGKAANPNNSVVIEQAKK
jgi:hypothetical protein